MAAAGSMVANSSNETQPTQMLQNILGGGPRAATTNTNASPFMRRVSPRQPAATASVYVSDETQGVYESQIGEDDTQSQKENAPKPRTLPNVRSRPISPIKPPPRAKSKPLTPQAAKSVGGGEEEADSLPPAPVSRGRSELSVMHELERLSPSPSPPDDSILLSPPDSWDHAPRTAAPRPSPPRAVSPPILSSQSQSQQQEYQPTQPLIVPDSQPEVPLPPPEPQPQVHAPSLADYAAAKRKHANIFPLFRPLGASPNADETQLGGSDGNTQPAPASQDLDAGTTQPLGGDGATQPLGGTQPLEETQAAATQLYDDPGTTGPPAQRDIDVLELWNHIQSRKGTAQTAEAEETQPLDDDIPGFDATPGQIPGLGSTQVREEGETQGEGATQVDPVPSSRISSARDHGQELFDHINARTRNAGAGPSASSVPRQRNASGPVRDKGQELFDKANERRSAPPSAPTQAEAEVDGVGSDETGATHGGSSPLRGRRDSGDSDIVPDSLAGSMPAPVSSHEPAKRSAPMISPDSDSEDDVPLANQMDAGRSRSPPNKRRRVEAMPVVPEDKSLSLTGIRAQKKGKPRQEDEDDEIPSSVPHEDKVAAPVRPSSKTKGKGKARAASSSSTKSTRSKSVTPATTVEAYDEVFGGSLSPLGASQDPLDCITKTEEPQPMEVEQEDVKPQISSTNSRKRKRSVAPPARNTRAKSARIPSGTPKAGPSRLRGNASTGRKYSAGDATRVFALWKGNGYYFPGTVRTQEGSSYVIDFDDSTFDTVPLESLRLLALEPGDKVTCSATQAVIVSAQGSSRDAAVEVRFIAGKDKDEKEDTIVECLQIHSRSISAQWRERMLKSEDIVPSVRVQTVDGTPTPSRTVTLDDPKYLSNVAFVITLSNSGDERARTHDNAKRKIKRHGGVLLEEWSDLYHMPCAPDAGRGGGRWAWDPAGFEFKPRAAARSVERVFLLSDMASHKSKYIMALALGIPCLGIDALDDPEFTLNWQRYLLPAGFSNKLNAKVSQLIDYDWGADSTHMSDVMNAEVDSPSVALRPFTGKAMLIAGPEFVKTGRKPSGSAGEEYGMPEILLCAGAKRVVAMREVPSKLDEIDFVVVKDTNGHNGGGVPVVSTAWVKDCIISGRLHAR